MTVRCLQMDNSVDILCLSLHSLLHISMSQYTSHSFYMELENNDLIRGQGSADRRRILTHFYLTKEEDTIVFNLRANSASKLLFLGSVFFICLA